MPRGGKREKAGRPQGGVGRRVKEAVAVAEATGIMPGDVLLWAMRHYHAVGDHKNAAIVAAAAAPYFHRKKATEPLEETPTAPIYFVEVIRVVTATDHHPRALPAPGPG